MNTLTIILAAYVALDIITGIVVYALIRANGWTRWEIARQFRNLLRWHQEDYVEEFLERYGDEYDADPFYDADAYTQDRGDGMDTLEDGLGEQF